MNNKAGATCEFQGPKVTNVMVSEGFLYKDKHGSCAFSAFFFFYLYWMWSNFHINVTNICDAMIGPHRSSNLAPLLLNPIKINGN